MITFLIILFGLYGIGCILWYGMKLAGKLLASPYTLYKTFLDDGISPGKSLLIVVIIFLVIGLITFFYVFFF